MKRRDPYSVTARLSPSRGGISLLLSSVLLGIIYFLAAATAIALTGQAGNVAAVWIAGAILLAALIGTPPKRWWPLLAAAGVADVAASLFAGSTLAVAAVVAVSDIVEPLLVMAILSVWGDGRPWHLTGRSLLLFTAAVIVAAVAAPMGGSAALALMGAGPFLETWRTWAIADALGVLIVVPLLLSWRNKHVRQELSRPKVSEGSILTLLLAGVALFSFSGAFPLLFLVMPFLVLLTLRAGVQGATAGVSTVALIAIAATWSGHGPIAGLIGLDFVQKIQILQLYLFACLLSSLPLAIVLSQGHELQLELGLQEQINSAALNNMAHGLSMYDEEDRLVTYNHQYLELYDVPKSVMKLGAPISEVLTYLTANGIFKGGLSHFLKETADSGSTGGLTEVELGDGRTVHIQRRPLPDGGWVATHEDVTAKRESHQRIAYLAKHDPLTGLTNRAFFADQLELELFRAARGQRLALLTLDLDRFKEVNDSLGHWYGDKILQQVAERLRKAVRDGDVITRLGGDEFAVLQTVLSRPGEAATLATRILKSLSRPYDVDGHSILVAATVGIAVAPRDGCAAEELFKKSDVALYRAKAEARGTFRFFEKGMDDELQRRRIIEAELRSAVTNQEFELYYQPILTVADGSIGGFEALIRWHHPTRGLVQPQEFISVAEETGLIIPIGDWVLRQACRDAADWPDDLKVSVNVSPVQFKRGDLVRLVKDALSEASLPAGRLELEMTETAVLDDEEWVRAVLHQLRAAGVGLAMDDFGTGYSSLAYLRRFLFSRIKIDRGFVVDLAHASDARAIVAATVTLANDLGIATTAEGVETNEQRQILESMGCSAIQGYLIGKPAPSAQAIQLIEKRQVMSAGMAHASSS
jgi:diguanylate cyclase (GGDEF)-like protein